MSIDQLMIQRRDVGHDAEPAERIHPLVLHDTVVGNARAADTVITVAPHYEIALELILRSSRGIANARRARVEADGRDVLCLPDHSSGS